MTQLEKNPFTIEDYHQAKPSRAPTTENERRSRMGLEIVCAAVMSAAIVYAILTIIGVV